MRFGKYELPNVTKDNHVVLKSNKVYTLPHKCKRDFLSGAVFTLFTNPKVEVSIMERHTLLGEGIKYAVIYWHRNMPPFTIDLEEPFQDDSNEWKVVETRYFTS